MNFGCYVNNIIVPHDAQLEPCSRLLSLFFFWRKTTILSHASAHGCLQLKPKKSGGWALTRTWCLNSPTIPVQAPTLDPKLTDRRYWIDTHCNFARASFNSQPGSRESCILLYRKRTNLKSHCHGFAVFITCSMQISYCEQRMLRMRLRPVCTNLATGVVVPETHWNSLRELNIKLWTFESPHKICIVGSYTEELTTHRTVKIGGWALARGRALARDNTVIWSS